MKESWRLSLVPLSDILHQDSAVDRLRRALASSRVPHAYLFTGPSGVGKEMLAARFAQLLLCSRRENPADGPILFGSPTESQASGLKSQDSADACGQCDDCLMFAAGTHPDFHRIHRALNKQHPDKAVQRRKAIDLSVDVIRHFVLDRIMLRAARDRAKVFMILEADRLSNQAQNALLKTLEEPPGPSYLILLASSLDELLPTTRSRCQHIAFNPLPDAFVLQQLSIRKIAAPQAAFLTQLAQGSLGSAIRFAEMGLFEKAKEVLAAVQLALDDPLGTGKALLDLSKELAGDSKKSRDDDEEGDTNASREAQSLVIAMASAILRDVQRAAIGVKPITMPGDPSITKLAARTTTSTIGSSLRALSLAEYEIDQNANTTLVFDSIGIAISQAFGKAHATR